MSGSIRDRGVQEKSDTQPSMDSHLNGSRKIGKQIIIRLSCANAVVEVHSGCSSYVVCRCRLTGGKPIIYISVQTVITLEISRVPKYC